MFQCRVVAGDIGQPKATVAASFINRRVPTCHVTSYYNKIQDFGADFYNSFHIIVCGLDSIPARRWLNRMLVSLLQYDGDQLRHETIKPLIDGGTEGFKGSVRAIYPGQSFSFVELFSLANWIDGSWNLGMNACIECTLDLYPPQTSYPLCTIANTPRLPEHCIEWAKIMAWPEKEPFGAGVEVDGDNPDHVSWIMKAAQERATQYGIKQVTYRLTQGHFFPMLISSP